MAVNILELLNDIEKENNADIIFACIAGSRATGLGSYYSDYDVRFIYKHRDIKDYISLHPKTNDVISYINETEVPEIEAQGWELKKALYLLNKSNISIFGWFYSPAIIRETEISKEIKEILPKYFSIKNALWQYLGKIKHHIKQQQDEECVSAKDYLKIIYPLLQARYVIIHETIPPVKFDELVEETTSYKDTLYDLVQLKKENKMIIIEDYKDLNDYIIDMVPNIEKYITSTQTDVIPFYLGKKYGYLNNLFYKAIGLD